MRHSPFCPKQACGASHGEAVNTMRGAPHATRHPQLLPLASLQAPHRSSRLIGHVHCALARHAQNEAREIRAPNLLIWSQTRCHCAIAPPIKHVPATAFTTTCHLASSALTILSARAQPTTHPQGCSKTTWTVCPSGLRGWTQVPLARAAWAQIPQLSFAFPGSAHALEEMPRPGIEPGTFRSSV